MNDSNTTLVKVKLEERYNTLRDLPNSNTTLVKVKSKNPEECELFLVFKYNTC